MRLAVGSLLVAAVIAAAPLGAAEPTAENELAAPLGAWQGGPVRYLITAEEEREFRSLTDDAARLEFIRRFWGRRDPTRDTPENELRDLFWRRVAEANRLFVETIKQGWKTDRGRIYILLGPPDEQETDPVRKEGRGEIRWIYRSAPTPDSGPNQIVAFREDASGEYRLSSNPRDYSLVFDFVTRSSVALGPTADGLAARARMPGVSAGRLQQDLTELGRAPREEELVAALVSVEARLGERPFLDRFDFFCARDGSTFVAITLGVQRSFLPPGADPGSLLPVARLERIDAPGPSLDFVYRNPFAPAPDNDRVPPGGHLLYQASQSVPPGRYRAYVGLFDRNTGEVASRNREIGVPAFPVGSLSLSSLVLARQASPLDAKADIAAAHPFALGGLLVVPRVEPILRNGEDFSLYYQVYGAANDAEGRAMLDAEYRFFVAAPDGERPVGEPIRIGSLTGQALGWSFPVVGWPVARFRLLVTVIDRATGRSATGMLEFSIAG